MIEDKSFEQAEDYKLNIEVQREKSQKSQSIVEVKSSEMSKGVKAGQKQSSNPINVNDLSYVRRLLALLQAQGKM